MKITAISAEYSDQNTIALITEPPLTPEIFEEVQRLSQTPAFTPLALQLMAGCLLIQFLEFTPELRDSLEALLTQAEAAASPSITQGMTQQEVVEYEKKLTLESAAAGLGLPIA